MDTDLAGTKETIEQKLQAARSRVYGREAALAERAVVLLDKLSRCVIYPYAMSSSEDNLTANVPTQLSEEDYRNRRDGVFLMTKARLWVAVAEGTTSVNQPAFNAQFSFMVGDEEGHHWVTRHPVFGPVLFDLDSSTWYLDRPYILDRASALFVQAFELAGNATRDMRLTFLGESVAGDMTAAEVEEAILLGVYPVAGRQSSIWDHALIYNPIFRDRPARLKGEAADLLDALRTRVARLRKVLREAPTQVYVLEADQDLTASAVTTLPQESLRNDGAGPLAITRVRAYTTTALAASAAGAMQSNVAGSLYSVAERVGLTAGQEAFFPTLFNTEEGAWDFHHPHVLRQGGSVLASLRELAGDGSTSVYLMLEGEVLEGVAHADVRQAISLGLYPVLGRYFE